MTIRDAIASHHFFAGLDPAHVERLARCATEEHFPAGRYLLREGEPAGTFRVLTAGDVALQVHTPGKGIVRIETLHGGDVLGWSWMFPPYRWQFDAYALNAVNAIAFPGVWIREECEADPAFGYQLVRRVAAVMMDRLQHTRLRLLNMDGDVART